MGEPTRIVMLGTGDFALPTFELLAERGHEMAALVTQPDRPQGRRQEITPAAIAVAARARGVRVFQPENVNDPASLAVLRSFAPDLLITAAYGQILSAEALAIGRMGGVNLHGSILPAYRGAAPVARAIQNGEVVTGVTVIQMTPRIDAGGIVGIGRLNIDPDETAGELEARLARLGAPLLADCIPRILAGTATIIPQDIAQVTRAPKLKKEESAIKWTRPALDVHNMVRAMQPWPVASTMLLREGVGPSRLIVHKTAVTEGSGEPGAVVEAENGRLTVACGDGAVALLLVQTPGGRPLTAAEFLNGRKIARGDTLKS